MSCLESEFLLNDYRNSPNSERSVNYRRPPRNERIPKRTARIFTKLRIAHIMHFSETDQMSYKATLEKKSNLAFRFRTALQSLGADCFHANIS